MFKINPGEKCILVQPALSLPAARMVPTVEIPLFNRLSAR